MGLGFLREKAENFPLSLSLPSEDTKRGPHSVNREEGVLWNLTVLAP